MVILSIDCTQEEISCALYLDSKRLTYCQWVLTKTEKIPECLAQLLNNQELKPSDINRLAVVTGPGNYSSLRNGLITIKTMSQFLNIPIVAFSKADVICYRYRHLDSWLLPVLDVRQNMLYVAIGRYQQANQQIEYRQQPMFIQRSTLAHLNAPELMLISPTTYSEWSGLIERDVPYGYACEAAEMAALPTATALTFEHLQPLYARPAVQ